MQKTEEYIHFDEELKNEQYESLEYLQGDHDGMVEAIGMVQRLHARGKSCDEIIDALWMRLSEKFDKYKNPGEIE